jgi:predicted  nucleic acid-binding Zn-ribbon protein
MTLTNEQLTALENRAAVMQAGAQIAMSVVPAEVEAMTVEIRTMRRESVELRAKLDDAEEEIEDLQDQVVPVGEICRMFQGRATPNDKATIAIWLTIQDQLRRAVQP